MAVLFYTLYLGHIYSIYKVVLQSYDKVTNNLSTERIGPYVHKIYI